MIQSRRLVRICQHDFSQYSKLNVRLKRSYSLVTAYNSHDFHCHRERRGDSRLQASRPQTCHIPTSSLGRRLITTEIGAGEAIAASLTSGTSPVILMQNLIEAAHIYGQLPWWLSILGTSLLLRPIFTLPFSVYQQRAYARLELLQPVLTQWSEALKDHVLVLCKREGVDYAEYQRRLTQEVRGKYKELLARDRCHPVKTAAYPILLQLPIWIVFSLAIRNLVGFPIPYFESTPMVTGLDMGGAFWFVDLTAPDPYLVFPLVTGASTLLNIELGAKSVRAGERSRRQVIVTNALRGVSIAMVFVTAQLPSAISLYWASSSLYRLGENILVRLPSVRRRLQIPETPSESKTPLRDAWLDFKQRNGVASTAS